MHGGQYIFCSLRKSSPLVPYDHGYRKATPVYPLFSFFFLICITHFFFGCISLRSENNIAETRGPLPPVFVADKDPVTMLLIPAGYFIMGSNTGGEDEKPCHRVYLDAFYIDETEVTCRRYARFLQETGYPPHPMWNPEYDRSEDPVVGVSWYDAVSFARWAGKQLPTEAQWEKAARGGLVGKKFPFGDAIDRKKANYLSFGTMPVKSCRPNGYGLYDAAGNVWEWCRDWYSPGYYRISPEKTPPGPLVPFSPGSEAHGMYTLGLQERSAEVSPASEKVVRGGAWYCNRKALRVANRFKHNCATGSFNIGFRCVKPAE